MKRYRSKGIILLSILLILCISILFIGCPKKSKPIKLTILHMNDTHAHYLPDKVDSETEETVGGFSRAMTVIRNVWKSNLVSGRQTLLLHAGDLSSGTMYSTVYRGTMGIKLLNKMKFDAMTIGNHEFDYGFQTLLNLQLQADFKMLSANILNDKGKHPFQEYWIKRFEGKDLQIVIFGLTTPTTPVTTHPANVKGFTFLDPIETSKKLLDKFSDEDLVIALTHLGVDVDKKLAEACPKIDLIIGGHSHTILKQPLKVNQTIICQAGYYSQYVGQIDIDVEKGKIIKYDGKLYHLTEEYPDDEKLQKTIDNFTRRLEKKFEEPIATTKIFLDGERDSVRSKETNLGKLICKVMVASTDSEVALMNGGGIRTSINEGEIKLKDVYNTLPFDNNLILIELKGEDLVAVLQRSNDLKPGDGGKLHTFGIEYNVKDGKVNITKIRNEDFNSERFYKIALPDFLAAGGDGYSIFPERAQNTINTGAILRDSVISYLKRNKEITEELLK
ncbi:MAG: 5'-nucleotidase C-terminal domain-containing protein [bacterium]|nr:5'-nucleotidase C-terminal domain-containing protein [bacterium]